MKFGKGKETIIGVIPARYGSTRLSGKVLLPIAGKPMIQHVWERAKRSQMLDQLLIACDDKRIFDVAKGFGAAAVMTSTDHVSGTDRLAEAVEDLDFDIIVNIQADEPLIQPCVIDDLAYALTRYDCPMATVISDNLFGEELTSPDVVKAVIDRNHDVVYFSRSLIPFERKKGTRTPYYKHLGIYAYRKEFLLKFKQLPHSFLEQAEELEQLRALEWGYKIKAVLTDVETIGVDVEQDLQKVEEFLKKEARLAKLS